MFSLLKKLFRSRPNETRDPEEIAEELWQTNFRKPAASRFLNEDGESYSARITAKGLSLEFKKKNVYAWTMEPLYRYRDFILEALIEFPEDSAGDEPATSDSPGNRAGSLASGLLFRYLSGTTFYSVLLSDRGMVRMDAMVNGYPVPVLGWTETRTAVSPGDDGEQADEKAPYQEDPHIFSLRIIARGTTFTLIVNDAWVAECTDDTIQAAGKLAFAGQNWNGRERAAVLLNGFLVDSRPMEVETVYTRWNSYIRIPPEAHINLARTWYAMGKYVPSILELRRAWKERKPGTEEMLLSGQIYLAQKLLPEAEEQVRRALAMDHTHEQAAAELGGILYLGNRFVELEDLLNSLPAEAIGKSAFLSNLEGHLRHWKGEHGRAAEAYRRAAALNPDQGLFFFHEGNELADAGDAAGALDAWLEAARIFMANEEYTDLAGLIPRLREAAGGDSRVEAIAGKYYYAMEREDEALEALARAATPECTDSAVWYLLGMIRSGRRQTGPAIAALRKAVELEGGYGPYRFRLAETLFFAGENCDAELGAALDSDAQNGWVHNLAALKAIGENDFETAERHIQEARRLLPEELPVIVNLAEIKRCQGKLDEALSLLHTDDPRALRAGANLLVEDGRHEEAESWYIEALRHSPLDAELLTDRAANCLELDLLSEADDLLGKAMDQGTTPRLYQLFSYLAGRKGEYARAEVALKQGLSEYPGNADLLHELAAVYLHTNRAAKASEILVQLEGMESSERVRRLAEEIENRSTDRIACSKCARVWRVPKEIPAQGSLHLTAEPPDDLPAGTCPECRETWCIGCARETLGDDGRFRCLKCGRPLKLIESGVIWLLNRWQAEQRDDPRG